MRLSTYTHIVRLPGGEAVVMNLPRRSVDRVPAFAADELEHLDRISPEWADYALDVGYLTEATRAEEVEWFRALVRDLRQAVMPANVMFVTTNSCNLACSYCFQADSGMRSLPEKHLTLAEAETALEQVARLMAARGVARVELIGGEPLLPRQSEVVVTIVRRLRELGLPVRVTTNGVFLDRFRDLLGPTQIDELQISLDGTAATHDLRRVPRSGVPTFEGIVRNIEMALRRGVRVLIRPNIDRRNIHDLPHLIELLKVRGILDDPLVTFNYASVRRDPFSPDAGVGSHYMELSEIDEYLRASGTPLVSIPGAAAHTYEPLSDYLNWIVQNPMVDACGAPSRNIYFAPGGGVFNCHELVGRPDAVVGRLASDRVVELPIWDVWRKRTVDELVNCRECPLAFAHGGGCGARLTGDALGAWGVCDDFPQELDDMIVALASANEGSAELLWGSYGSCSA